MVPAPAPRLSNRALNRALLARQGLLEPWSVTVTEAVERLVGMQAQAPTAPYTGLWTRIPDFDPLLLSTLVADGSILRLAMMRSTIHLVSSTDCRLLRPVVQPALDRSLRSVLGRRADGVDQDAVALRARELVQQRPRTFAELGPLLAETWPTVPAEDLTRIARTRLALVQLPPRGLWGTSGPAVHTTAEHWPGIELADDRSPRQLILRYLAAFGPATVADVQAWSGLTGLRASLAALRPDLVTYRNERDQELLDVPDGLLPPEGDPVPPVIVGGFDNLLLSHVDRARIFDDSRRAAIMGVNGIVRPTFLIDGLVAGTCRVDEADDRVTVTFTAFQSVRRTDRSALTRQGRRLAAFLTPGRVDVRVEFAQGATV